jgi:hypothetical protein
VVREIEIAQLVFEITAMLVLAEFSWAVTGNTRVLDQGRFGIRHVLERVSAPTGCKSQSSETRAARKRSHSRA